jgi:hypothetical protein
MDDKQMCNIKNIVKHKDDNINNIQINVNIDSFNVIINIDKYASVYDIKYKAIQKLSETEKYFKWIYDFCMKIEIDKYNITYKTKSYSDDIYIDGLSDQDNIVMSVPLEGGKSKTIDNKTYLLIVFSIITLIYIGIFLFLGLLPILARIYTYVFDYLWYKFYNLPYIYQIMSPFASDFKTSKLPSIMLFFIKTFLFSIRSFVDILTALFVFIVVYAFAIIGLFVPLYGIQGKSIQKSLERSRYVSYILTMIYIFFYFIVNLPLILREFFLYLSTNVVTEKKSPEGNFLLSLTTKLMDFQVLLPFFGIQSISTTYMQAKMSDLDNKSEFDIDTVIYLLTKLDLSRNDSQTPEELAQRKKMMRKFKGLENKISADPTNMINMDAVIDEVMNIVETYLDTDAMIRLSDISELLGGIYMTPGSIVSKFATEANVDKEFVYAIFGFIESNKMKEDLLEHLKIKLEDPDINEPYFAVQELSRLMVYIVTIIAKPFYAYRTEIVPSTDYMKYRMSGMIPGYFTSISFVISYIYLAIFG